MVVWGEISPPTATNRYPSYQLCTAYESEVFELTLVFDIKTMAYVVETRKLQMPPSGLHRKHVVGAILNKELVTGTHAGDLCVFNLQSK